MTIVTLQRNKCQIIVSMASCRNTATAIVILAFENKAVLYLY